MCLILIAYQVHPNYPLVFAANRDEFYHRPTVPADFWEDAPQVIGGRDLEGGGTWMGITTTGRFAGITNFRDPRHHKPSAPSRGKLVEAFLKSDMTPIDYLYRLETEGDQYNGFSMIFGTPHELFYFSNRQGGHPLFPGIHGLSNAFLNTPWPKVRRGTRLMNEVLADRPSKWVAGLFHLLADCDLPPDNELPQTGIGIDWERILAPIFITSPIYGTRSSTVLTVNHQGRVHFEERSFNGNPEPWMSVVLQFSLERG